MADQIPASVLVVEYNPQRQHRGYVTLFFLVERIRILRRVGQPLPGRQVYKMQLPALPDRAEDRIEMRFVQNARMVVVFVTVRVRRIGVNAAPPQRFLQRVPQQIALNGRDLRVGGHVDEVEQIEQLIIRQLVD
ncbi:hypothetical protein D3C84_961790 [compost metagenome]